MPVNERAVIVGEERDVTDVLLTRRIPWGAIFGAIGVFLAVAVVAVLFYKQSYSGLVSRDSMDIAQIARNIKEGHGFTTRFARPFNAASLEPGSANVPEMNHAPLYPYLEAGLFRLKSPCDQVAIWTSLSLLFLTALATYLLGRILFDHRTGLLASVVFGISAPVLKVGISGEEWTMAALWMSLLMAAVGAYHVCAANEKRRAESIYAGLAGLLCAALYMTNHVLIFLAIPLVVYFAVTGVARKRNALIFVVVLVAAVLPWAWRDGTAAGCPVLGANAWDLVTNTTVFPTDTFFRSTDAAQRSLSTLALFPIENFPSFAEKVMRGLNSIAGSVLTLLGLAAVPFVAVSLLYRFKSPQANAVRGLVYGLAAVAALSFAAYSIDPNALVIFAPIAAVLGSAYFMLLVRAKKLHIVFYRALLVAFLLATALPTLVCTVWPEGVRLNDELAVVNQFFGRVAETGFNGWVYTDVPWMVAWRTKGAGVWLPRTDQDIERLSDLGLPMKSIVLTPESGRYDPQEVWYVLHKCRLWREYVRDPESGLKQILEEVNATNDRAKADMYLRRLKRSFAVSQSIAGFTPEPSNPLVPDDIQILVDKRER